MAENGLDPGTIIFRDGLTKFWAVVIDMNFWATKMHAEDPDYYESMRNIPGLIPLRVLGEITDVDHSKDHEDDEPSESLIRRYAAVNTGGHLIVEPGPDFVLMALNRMASLGFGWDRYVSTAKTDVRALRAYLAVDYDLSNPDGVSPYHFKLYRLFEKAIPK